VYTCIQMLPANSTRNSLTLKQHSHPNVWKLFSNSNENTLLENIFISDWHWQLCWYTYHQRFIILWVCLITFKSLSKFVQWKDLLVIIKMLSKMFSLLIRYVRLWPLTLTRWPWPLTLNVCSILAVRGQTLYQIWAQSSNPLCSYCHFRLIA